MKFLTSLFLAFAISAQAAPLTNTVTFNWLDFGYQVDSVTNKPVKITPLEYATIGSFFMVKTPRIYTNTFAGQCIVTNWQEGSYRVELATALGSITTFTSTIPSTATGSSNYDATSFVTNYATNSGSTRSYSITVSDLRYPSVAGTNIVFTTNAGRVTIAGTVVTGTSPAVASNYLAVTKLDITNGTAYALTVSGLFSSTNMDAKISSASNTVHTALNATNTILATNISSLNTAANNNAANVTSISNRVIQAEVTNAVQQTALAGLTNSIATLNTNYIATTNGMSRGLTNLGQAYSDRLVVTNLIVGTNANIVVVSNGNIKISGAFQSTGSASAQGFTTLPADGSGSISAGSYGTFTFGSGVIFAMSWDTRSLGALNMYRTDTGKFSHLNWGNESQVNSMATLYTGLVGSDMTLMNGGLNFSTSTNKLTVPRFQVSSNSFSAIITNIMTTNVVWDFPSTSVGAVADLGATITGVKDGDVVTIGPPQAVMTSIIGSYSGFASNGVAFGRFLPLAVTQDPASGTFRVVVHQYR